MKRFFIYLFFAFLLISCAQQSPLSGGEKDVFPPKVQREWITPKNESTHFNSSVIVLPFDEFVRLKQPNKKIVITPTISFTPKYEVKGKKILVRLQPSKLSANTTYTINFADAITDITEGNKLTNFTYVFSTGEKIDSLRLRGRVQDVFSKEPVAKIIVGLYPDSLGVDSVAIKHKPYYFTETNASGGFSFSHLKKGRYSIVAFEDKNNNLRLDASVEKTAFLDSTLLIDSDTLSVLLQLFEPMSKKIWINSKTYKHPGKVQIILNREALISDVFLYNNTGNQGEKKFSFREEDTLEFWIKTIEDNSSLQLGVQFEQQKIDTIQVKIKIPKKFKDTLLMPVRNNITKNKLPFFQPFTLTFNTPISSVESSKIGVYNVDTLPYPHRLMHESRQLKIDGDFQPENTYQIVLLPKAVQDYYGRTNDSIRFSFTVDSPSEYGNIQLQTEFDPSQHYLVYLTRDNSIVRKIYLHSAQQKIGFENLTAGTYRLKACVDENNNRKWDSGDYLEHQQPEKVILYDEPLEIKAGWDLDIVWKIKRWNQ